MKLDLHNQTLRVALNMSPPFVFLQWNEDRHSWQGTGGIEMRLVDTLSEYFNFSYEIINCNQHWGSRLANNTWNGLIGLLSTGQSDFGIGGITLTFDRAQAVPFLYPHIVTSVTFITPAPSSTPNLYMAFKPLSSDVWIYLAISLVFCALFDIVYNLVHRNGSYVKVFWLSMYSMFRQQCKPTGHESTSMNTWMFFWSVAAFVLTTGYAGCLCSLITIPNKMQTIDTVLELAAAAKSGKVVLIGIQNSAYTDALINSELTLYKELGKVLQPVRTKTDGFETVIRMKKPHAFISMRESLRYGQLNYGEDQIYITPEGQSSALFIDLLMVPVRPAFEYKASFDLAINRLIATGLVLHWKESEYLKLQLSNPRRNEPLEGSANQQFEDFSLSQLQSFFYIYLFATVLSTICFVVECFCFFTNQ